MKQKVKQSKAINARNTSSKHKWEITNLLFAQFKLKVNLLNNEKIKLHVVKTAGYKKITVCITFRDIDGIHTWNKANKIIHGQSNL